MNEQRIETLKQQVAKMKADMTQVAKMNRQETIAKCKEYLVNLPEGYDGGQSTYKMTTLLKNMLKHQISRRSLAAKQEIVNLMDVEP